MQRITLTALLLTITLIFSINANAKEWYQGGTLHNATYAQWNNATYQNKLATAGDWASPTDLKYKDKNPELYREFDQARNILDSWRGEREELSQAQQLLASVIKTDATYAPAYRELGRLYIMGGYINRDNYKPRSLSPAEAAIRKSIDIEPGYADAYVLLGHLYTNMNQYDQARSALQKGESLGTKSPWLQLNWAALLEKQGESEAAVKRYKVVVDVDFENWHFHGGNRGSNPLGDAIPKVLIVKESTQKKPLIYGWLFFISV